MDRPGDMPGRDTRQALLEAALDLFAEHGYAGTSMRALARAAGVRESAIYHHFASKESLFAALVDMILDRRVDSATSEMRGAAGLPPAELLGHMARFMIRRL